ncbi:hypothetical protein YDYSG_47640 [Paenibacillus tyrfis]|uniref:hypothetical protein n=1 Tax=Paenibacillus tyrfis TaxID=1501230 RepID=UPI002490AAFC|nr:hypothetical protein [Paenibacillus tyrfis]GLI08732.1 hypothetical protein YDYSG_47640 [Paenibacillus tyrfis]
MTVPVICIAIAVILVIALIMYNMRSMMSSPVPRSERQFPGHPEKEQGLPAEEPAGPDAQEAAAAKPRPAEQKREPQGPAANQERAGAVTAQVPPAAEQEAGVRAAAQKPIAQSGRARTPEADAEAEQTSTKLADPEYRQALRGFAQPATPGMPSEKAGEAPMKDDDFRTALRSMHDKKQ